MKNLIEKYSYNKVFLGGTTNFSDNEKDWRNYVSKNITCNYFNPIVNDWTPECRVEEEKQKLICNIHLYVITPQIHGVFSIAEVVESVMTNFYTQKNKTVIFCFLKDYYDKSFDERQIKSLNATCELLKKYNCVICKSLKDVVNTINAT